MAEKGPIIRLMFAKIKESFADLSEKEKMEYMRKDRENLDQLGCRVVMMVDCRWSSEDWDYIGIEEWPTMEALRRRAQFEREELEVSRMAETKAYMGTRESFEGYGEGEA